MKPIYLDNNATTPVLDEVWAAMASFHKTVVGNPASSHSFGRQARQALEDARERTAHCLGASPAEVIFTSGATEANNLAVFGLAGQTPGHVLVSAVEHPCITEPAAKLAACGFDVATLPVSGIGVVSPKSLRDRLCQETRLVCVMLANHETGAIQPVHEIAATLSNHVDFHCDAAAAVGRIPVHFHELGVTSLTLSAHKFHGPQGVGALLLRSKKKLKPLFHGGHQQQGRRPGTEPVALVVGLAKALELALAEMESRRATVIRLRRVFLEFLRENAAPVVLNGPEDGVPHTVNLSFPGCKADILLAKTDLAGVACSTGSACSSGSLLPSPVLRAMGVPDDVLHSAMRFSFSHLLTEAVALEAGRRIASVVRRLRGI